MLKFFKRDLKCEADCWRKKRPNFCQTEKESLYLMKKFIQSWIEKFWQIPKKPRILEIGGGGRPIVNFFENVEKYTLDPLMDFYQGKFPDFYQDQALIKIKSEAEEMPFKDNFFDLILMLNALDHTENPKKVLGQCYRVLKSGGIMAISVDTYLWFWKIFRKTSPLFGHKFYLCHPQTFTNRDVKKLISEIGLKILHSFVEDEPKFDSRKLRMLTKLKYNIHRLYILAQK